MTLRDQLHTAFQHDAGSPLPADEFNRLALDVFAFQYEHNLPYRAYCDRRDRRPGSIEKWTDIPAVPTAAFKEVALVAGEPGTSERVFRTSGTTRGAEKRGTHYILDLEMYHEALLPMFRAYVLPDVEALPIVSLIPPAGQVPDSSLSEMISTVSDRLGVRTEWFVDVERGLDAEALIARFDESEQSGQPVCVVGTSFAFVHLIDALVGFSKRFYLPAGSRVMDTGGFKGRSRSVPADELRHAYFDYLGVSGEMCVNEYGMTEMCSQFYDSALRDHVLGRKRTTRMKVPAPWVRSRVVDPETLAPLPDGAVGLLQHFDLANLYSVVAVQTEDLGRMADGTFETLGRVEGAAPRGCSIAMDLLLQATRGLP